MTESQRRHATGHTRDNLTSSSHVKSQQSYVRASFTRFAVRHFLASSVADDARFGRIRDILLDKALP
jgi:hypothetical protein